jgi:O-antigen/teichoic acid export membrane protein
MSIDAGGEISETIPDADILASREAGGRFLRGGGIRVAAYVIGLLVGLASTPLVTRHLGPIDWGHFITVTSVIFIAVALTEGGVGNLGVQEYSNGSEAERRAFMSNLVGLRLMLASFAAIGAVSFTLLAGYPKVMVEGTALACIGLLLEALRATLAIALTVRLRLGWLAVCDFAGQFMTALSMILLVLGGARLLPFFLVSVATSIVTLTLTAVLVRQEVDLRPRFSPARWRSLMAGSLIYAAATTLGVAYFRIVVIAMSLLATKHQIGYFGLSFRVLDIVNGIPWLLVASAFPILARAAHNDDERLRYALQRLFDGSLVAGGLFSVCVIIGAPFAVDVVGGSSFHPSIAVLQILGLGIIGTFLVAVWSFALLTLRLYRELIVANGIVVVLAVLMCVLLIPSHEARGAATVTATLEVVLACSYALVLSRRRPDLRPSLQLLPRVALAIGLAIGLGLILPVDSVLATAASVLVMLSCLAALRAFPAEFLQALRARPGG